MARFDDLATLHAVKQALRDKYAWPGGYPLYIIMADCEVLSIGAAREHWDLISRDTLAPHGGIWKAGGVAINWDDPALYCCHSGERIESAYAEPEEESE